MANKVLDIDVTVAAKGRSSDDGVDFSFKSASSYLDDAAGNITLPADGQPVEIRFSLKSTDMTWGDKPNAGTFPMSFSLGGATTGADALWVWPDGAIKGKTLLATFTPAAIAPTNAAITNRVVSTLDKNDDKQSYHYCLAVGIVLNDGSTLIQRHDPRIRNGSVDNAAPLFTARNIVLAVGAIIVGFVIWKLMT